VMDERLQRLQAALNRDQLAFNRASEGRTCEVLVERRGKLPGLKRLIATFARSRPGVDFESIDGLPTHLFFLLVVPEPLQRLAGEGLLEHPAYRAIAEP